MIWLTKQTKQTRSTQNGPLRTTVFSNRLLDFAATETAGTDPKAFRLTVDQCPDWLEVGLEDSLGFVIGVTDVMA